ncbi:hypothetical protein [Stygiolobus azoricus]|uniref:Uncharacterized protein n=1 Tax=Stygiolobus azoricus TaxID=41675 RepID=A0A650CRV9_9CREN|nr:hypothetical protein [Stygiolobus azoricus]QGR20392.1 hypothetical protein D1868_10620 [Stygiolobus azoricus]
MNKRTLTVLSLILVLLIVTEVILVAYYHYKVYINPSIFSSPTTPPSLTIPPTHFPIQLSNLTPPISLELVMNYYNVTYNSSLKLFSECPYVNKYFVENDNLLAVIALKDLNDSLWETVWDNIKSNITLSPYLVLVGIHNFTWEFKDPVIEKIWGPIYTISFNDSPNYLAWYEYANTSLLFSIYELENGNISLAEKVFETTINDFWNGYGFQDESTTSNVYASCNLALAIIAWKYIGNYNQTFARDYLPLILQMYSIAKHLQSPIGGYFSNYKVVNGTVIPLGNVNTETTSLFVIAFST